MLAITLQHDEKDKINLIAMPHQYQEMTTDSTI